MQLLLLVACGLLRALSEIRRLLSCYLGTGAGNLGDYQSIECAGQGQKVNATFLFKRENLDLG